MPEVKRGRFAGFALTFAPVSIILIIGAMAAAALDLKDAVVVTPPDLSSREKKAVQMLVEEVEKRSKIRWPILTNLTVTNVPLIAVSPGAAVPNRTQGPPEGFQIAVSTNPKRTVTVIGNDARGVLFGVGRLLRELRMQQGNVSLPDSLNVDTSPKYPLRGHQLGFRPKCNSYDAWDLPTWEQYYRDLAVFGCNAVELIPPRSDDDATSPHFPRPPMEMMIGMSRLADDYGIDVWIWYPAMDKDYSDQKTVEFALKEWEEVFSKLPRIDAVFVPGGDPGHTQPKYLMALLEKQTKNLHRYHPKAQMWVSPQGFTEAWMDEFLDILKQQRPVWLTGLVFGPQVRTALPKLREQTPSQYPIRHYPDITHSRQCQFPVPDWDVAYSVTEARECINPRPEDQAIIFQKTQPYTIGFLTYSEGCNDDVNKIIWSGLGWDPTAKAGDILREYSRYFIGERFTDKFAEGLLALERNWRGPLLANDGVEETLARFQALEKQASPADLRNWRFQQALFRAYYDASVRHRLKFETDLESRAMEALKSSRDTEARMREAERILEDRFADLLKPRIHTLAEALFQSISMQLSVDKYKAIAVDRGASLDTLEFPLNNRGWLTNQFAHVRKLASDEERRQGLEKILHWTDPGAGGFYDDLGHPGRQPHLVRGGGFAEDPCAMSLPRINFEEDVVFDEISETAGVPRRMSWIDHAESLYDAPLKMRYTGLDSGAHYKLRVSYGGDNFKRKIRLAANESLEIHPLISKPYPLKPVEFTIPQSATQSGELTLTWSGEPGLGGNGRVCQVSEVWLIKDSSAKKP